MKLNIDQEFKNLIAPLTHEERKLLEKNIIKEGCRDPIVLWNNTIIDGHNRYNICTGHDIQFNTVDVELENHNEAINWIIDNQLGKRNVPDSVKKYLIGKRYTGEKKVEWDRENQHSKKVVGDHCDHLPENETDDNSKLKSADKIAEQNEVSGITVRRSGTFSDNIDKIAESSGITPMDILTNTKHTRGDIKKVSTLEPEAQKEIVEKVCSGEVKSFKEALKPIIEEEDAQKLKEAYIDRPDTDHCRYVPFTPLKSQITMCPCGCGYGYCKNNEIWYNPDEILELKEE